MTLRKHFLAGAAVAALFAFGTNAANAISFTVQTANQNGVGFDASPAPGNNFNSAGAITATFNYSGPLNFVNNAGQNANNTGDLNSNFFNSAFMSGYSGSGSLGGPANANFGTQNSFLASSGSAANYQYGSFYTIGLGNLAAGTILTITHDDGASVYVNGVRTGTTTSGPTNAITESVKLTSAGNTILYYGRQNGTPSVLQVQVPEPLSLALVGTGLAAVGLLRRRCRKAAAAA